jgi:GTP-binding protein HflX
LTNAGRYAADQLFATLDTKTVRWELGEGLSALLSDTVGFVRDIPHHLVASFRATLEETLHANLLLHLVDVSSPMARHQMDVVDGVLQDLGCQEIPQFTLLNKVDVADHPSMAELLARKRENVFPISAVTGEGIDAVREAVAQRARGDFVDALVRVPHSAGRLLSELDRVAEVHSRRYTAEGVEVEVRIGRVEFNRLRSHYSSSLSVVECDDGREPETGPRA